MNPTVHLQLWENSEAAQDLKSWKAIRRMINLIPKLGKPSSRWFDDQLGIFQAASSFCFLWTASARSREAFCQLETQGYPQALPNMEDIDTGYCIVCKEWASDSSISIISKSRCYLSDVFELGFLTVSAYLRIEFPLASFKYTMEKFSPAVKDNKLVKIMLDVTKLCKISAN